MNPKIKEILQELTDYKKSFQPKKYLRPADQKMEFSDLSNLIGWLLQWSKMVIHFPNLDKDFKNNAFLLSEPLRTRFMALFEYCPELSEIFAYKIDRIEYSSTLTEKEKKEVMDFIDKNHTITMTRVRKLK